VKLTLLFRASEHGFLASEFHRLCDGKVPTITLVKAANGRMAAAYIGVDWGRPWGHTSNPRGFLASIDEGYTLQKHPSNNRGHVFSYQEYGPCFGLGLFLSNRCDENESSYSILGHYYRYGPEGMEPSSLFGSRNFRVLEYEVYQVEIRAIV
jgi:hypothetical protein